MLRIRTLGMGAVAALMIGTAPVAAAGPAQTANPFAQPSTLPLPGAATSTRSRTATTSRRFEEGMKRQLAEIEKIADNPAPADLRQHHRGDGEVRPHARPGVRMPSSPWSRPTPIDTLDKVQAEEAPKLAAHQDAIYLNPKLFARVKAIYDQRDKLKLDPEAAQLLKLYYQQFVHAGANLSDADKARLREINKRDATLETDFQQKLLAGTKAGALVVDDKADAGRSERRRNRRRRAGRRGPRPQGQVCDPAAEHHAAAAADRLTDRDTRKKLFEQLLDAHREGRQERHARDIPELAKLRAEKAKLLGYPNYAAYVLYNQMAKTPEAVQKFIGQLGAPTARRRPPTRPSRSRPRSTRTASISSSSRGTGSAIPTRCARRNTISTRAS